MTDLPDSPRFFFAATDMVFGVDWVYSKDMAGDYQAGYKTTGLDSIKIAYAAAALPAHYSLNLPVFGTTSLAFGLHTFGDSIPAVGAASIAARRFLFDYFLKVNPQH